MARLSPSSNISYHTADPRRQQDDSNSNNNNNNNEDDDQHDHDGPGLRISSPDYVDVDIPHHAAFAAAPGQQSPVSSSSEGYPSWLPKRPPPPAPGSTLHTLSTAMILDSGVGPADLPAAASPTDDRQQQQQQQQHPQTPVPFSGGRKPTPRSVRIVSMQDSNNAAAAHREQPTDRTTTTRTPDARLRAAIAAPPKFRSPGLHLELLRDPSWKTRLHFYLFPLLVLAHVPLQTFFDFNAVYILIQVAKFPSPDAPGVPGSGRNWVLGTIAYVACWFLWIFGVFLGYEIIYSFYRRWRFRRPLILPIYLSSPAFNFVAMSSYNNFCFLQHIRCSAFPLVSPNAVLRSAEGSLRDALAETCYFYAQNLPTIVTLLPRAGLALALLLSFFSPENLPGGLSLSDVDQSISRRDGTFFDQNTGALSAYAKGVLIANAAWAAWRTLVLLFSWVGLWVFSGHGCAGLCGPRSRSEEEEIGRSVSIQSEKFDSGLAMAMGASGADALPWSWKECSFLRVYEAYEFCLTLRAPRSEKSAEQPSEGRGFDGIEKVFAAVGLGGAAQPPPARRGMLSQDLFESPTGAPSRRSSAANGQGQDVIVPPPEALVHEKAMVEGAPLKNLPYPFPGFGPRDSGEQEQIPFPPSPAVPDEGEGDPDDEEEEEEIQGDIVVEVEDEEEDEDEEEEEDFHPRSSEEPSSFSGRASNSLSSLGQPITSRYPFAFRHPARGGSMSSTGSPPFAFSRATATPQSKSTSTRESHDTRSTGNADTTASSSPSAGSPVSAVSPTSSVPSPQDVRGMPMPPRHPAAGRQRPSTAPSPTSPTPAGGLSVTRPRHTFEEHRRQLRESVGSEVLPESDCESDRPPRSGQPSPDGSLEAREREDSVGLLSPPSSQPSPRASLLGSRNGSATSLARISGAFRPRSRSRNNSSGSGSGSASSRHNSHVSVSSASLALGRARTHSFIQGISNASRSSIELVLGRVAQPGSPLAAGAVRLGDTSDVDGSEGALSNPESHTFGLPVVGGAGSLLPRRTGARARTLESDPGRSSVSVSSSEAAATAAIAAAISTRARLARGHGGGSGSGSSSRARSSASLSDERQRQRQGTQSSPSPSILAGSVRAGSEAEETTSGGSTTTRTVTLGQAMSEAPSQVQTRAHTPAGVPITSSPPSPSSPTPQSSP